MGVRKTYGIGHEVATRDKGKRKELLLEDNESEASEEEEFWFGENDITPR